MQKTSNILLKPVLKPVLILVEILILIRVFIVVTSVRAEDKDTLSIKTKQIEVSRSKILKTEYNYQKIDIIDKTKIELIKPQQLSDVLKVIPGVYFTDYGGLAGVKTISTRGMASNNTSVLIDGVKVNSTQNGSFDFSSFIFSDVEQIELIKSGSSAFWGGNASSSVINLKSSNLFNKSLNFSYGNIGDYNFNFKHNFTLEKNNINISFGRIYSDGDYKVSSIQFNRDTSFSRQNNKYSNYNLHLNVNNTKERWSSNTTFQYAVNLFYNTNKRGVPGPVLQNQIENTGAKLTDEDLTLGSNFKFNILPENDIDKIVRAVDVKVLSKFGRLTYLDPGALYYSNKGLNNSFYYQDYGLKIDYTKTFEYILDRSSVDIAFNKLSGDMLDPSIEVAKRVNLALSQNYEINFINFLNNKSDKDSTEKDDTFYQFAKKISLLSSLRYDYFSDFGGGFSAFAGLNFTQLPLNSTLKLNLSQNFRPPSFNELYYLNYGNKDLKAEKTASFSTNWELSLWENFLISLDYSFSQTKDKIISLPKSAIVWTTYNLANVNISCYEVSANYLFNSSTTLEVSYLYQIPLDKTPNSDTYNKLLPYTPNEIVNLNFFITESNISINFLGHYNSFRYYTQNNNPNEYLPSYFSADLNVSYKILQNSGTCLLNVESLETYLLINNLFNAQYSLIVNYPLPGRLFRFGIKLNFL